MRWFRPVKPKIVGWNLEICELFGVTILLNASLLLLVITPFANLYIFYLLPAIVIHELAHAIVGRYVGYPNGHIIIWILGGLYYSDDFTIDLLKMNREERIRFALMVVAGPLSNLALSLLFYSAYRYYGTPMLFTHARLNLLLGLFNILPIPRLDGGQLLRALAIQSAQRRTLYFSAAILVTIYAILDGFWISQNSPSPLLLIGTIHAWRFAFDNERTTITESISLREYVQPGGWAWTDKEIPLHVLANQSEIRLWLIRISDHEMPLTLDRPFLLRAIKRFGDNWPAGEVARKLYANVFIDQNLSDLVKAMQKSYLPVVPVVDNDQMIGTIGYDQIKDIDPELAKRLFETVNPTPDE